MIEVTKVDRFRAWADEQQIAAYGSLLAQMITGFSSALQHEIGRYLEQAERTVRIDVERGDRTFFLRGYPIAASPVIAFYEDSGRDIAPKTITAASWTASVVTFTSAAHGFAAGDSIIVECVAPAAYNGTYTLTAVTTNTFSAALTSDPGTYVSGGGAFEGSPIDSSYYDATPSVLEIGAITFDYQLSCGPSALKCTYTGGMATSTDNLIAAYPDLSHAAEKQIWFQFTHKGMLGLDGEGGGQMSGGARKEVMNPDWWEAHGNLLPEVNDAIRKYRSIIPRW